MLGLLAKSLGVGLVLVIRRWRSRQVRLMEQSKATHQLDILYPLLSLSEACITIYGRNLY